jgi:hypothetical protein
MAVLAGLIDGRVIRRLTQFDPTETGAPTRVLFVVAASGSETVAQNEKRC